MRRLILTTSLAASVVLGWCGTSQAGTYQVYACASGTGANHSWVGSTNRSTLITVTDTCAAAGSLRVQDVLGQAANINPGDYGQFTFTGPPGTLITAVNGMTYLGIYTEPDIRVYFERGDGLILQTCPLNPSYFACYLWGNTHSDSNTPLSVSDGPASFTGLATPSFTIGWECASSTWCLPGGTQHHAIADISSATVTLSDAGPPSTPTTSGPLTTPPPLIHGSLSLTASATDGESGMGQLNLIADGTTVLGAVGAGCDYTYPKPCPTSQTSTITLDSTQLSDGVHSIAVQARDATQQQPNPNTATTSAWSITVDNTPPSLGTPASDDAIHTGLSGNHVFSANASDANGITSVAFETKPHTGSTWSELGTTTTHTGPAYQLAVDTHTLTDGSYDLRAIATDAAGNTTTTTRVNPLLIDNTAPTADLGTLAPLIATTTVSAPATASDAGAGIDTVSFETSPHGANTWTSTPATAAPPYAALVPLPADGAWDVRVDAIDQAGNRTRSAITTVTRDATAPSVNLLDPGTATSQTPLTATASDATTSVASVRFETRPAGAQTWTTIATIPSAPYTTTWDTTSLTAGAYELRAVATDAAGNTATSSPRILTLASDPGGGGPTPTPSITMTAPPALATGAFPVSATTTNAPTGSVVWIQLRPAGGEWSTYIWLSTPPYTTSIDTRQLPDGAYELRAVLNQTSPLAYSTTTSVRFDNTAPSVTFAPPPSLSGTITLTAQAQDASGVTRVRFEQAPAGSSTWTAVSDATTAPYTATLDSTMLASGRWQLRATATDAAGNTSSQTASVAISQPGSGSTTTTPPPGPPPSPPPATPTPSIVRLRLTQRHVRGHLVELAGTSTAPGRLRLVAGKRVLARPRVNKGRWHVQLHLARTTSVTLTRAADAKHRPGRLTIRVVVR